MIEASMVELVDTQDLKSCGRNAVRVQVPLEANFRKRVAVLARKALTYYIQNTSK